jgi:hypothetical protein
MICMVWVISTKKVHCSVCHSEGHTMNRHKERPKRNPRARGVMGRNRRSGATDIFLRWSEVSHRDLDHLVEDHCSSL